MSWQPQGPTRRVRRWGLVIVGPALIAAGLAAIVLSIVDLVGERDQLEANAVARGLVDEPLRFTAPEPGSYTIYVFGVGRVEQTACDVQLAGGERRVLSGSDQEVEYTLGSVASVGRFTTGAGEVSVVCEDVHDDVAEYFVTPGTPEIVRHILAIVAGAFVILAGIGVLIWGLIGKRVPVSGL